MSTASAQEVEVHDLSFVYQTALDSNRICYEIILDGDSIGKRLIEYSGDSLFARFTHTRINYDEKSDSLCWIEQNIRMLIGLRSGGGANISSIELDLLNQDMYPGFPLSFRSYSDSASIHFLSDEDPLYDIDLNEMDLDEYPVYMAFTGEMNNGNKYSCLEGLAHSGNVTHAPPTRNIWLMLEFDDSTRIVRGNLFATGSSLMSPLMALFSKTGKCPECEMPINR
jgi:hypothetical protein